MSEYHCDVLIIGSGVAAIQTALQASKTKNVILITKTAVRNSNTFLAQGGIAVAHASFDTLESHIQDTLEAGRYHNEREAVSFLVANGVDAVEELINSGMKFDRNACNQLAYGLEGAHSKRRILHSNGDATGKELIEFMIEEVSSAQVEIRENELAVEILLSERGSCIGAITKNITGSLTTYFASHVVLATGGCGMLYPFSTNGKNATGDGYALALQAGARLKDMEFVQFHPTGLFVNGEVKGLVSEAVRGEGARLINSNGYCIMQNTHPLGDLAPRHIVAQTIFEHMNQGEEIFLDISMIPRFPERFPTISALCEKNGLDWKNGKLPVAPASHFMMGGIEVDLEGRTNITGLYAVGEVACSGVHGANRLASNSLLEGLVFGKKLGEMLQKLPHQTIWNLKKKPILGANVVHLPDVTELKEKLLKHAGIVRNEKQLKYMAEMFKEWNVQSLALTSLLSLSREEIETVFMMLTANCIVNSALMRKESRGAHNRNDYRAEEVDWEGTSVIIHQSNMKGTIEFERVKA